MKFKNILALVLLVFFLSSCARVPVRPPPELPYPPTQEIYPETKVPAERGTIHHEVAPGETLWRISKMYDVKIDSIARANKLKQYSQLKAGQEIIVPNAAPVRPVIPLYKNKRWSYIIIHHTATDAGSALSINKMHLRRGFIEGLGYHFIIDNGTSGKKDGQIEVAPRWLKQTKGAHCKASGMNYKGIGIGIVGNMSERYISKQQFSSLVYLVNLLRKYYGIPLKNVIGHGQVRRARTECPGTNFPWKKFKAALESAE